jgi:PAS domain S-box-containing protein
VGILRVDEAGRCTYANERLAELVGVSAGELVGRSWFDFVTGDRREEMMESWSRSVAGNAPFTAEFRVHRKDGAVRWASASTLDLPDSGAHGFVLSVEETTERKRALAELEQLHKSLAETSRRAGMAEVASGVLHNVGNVLNSLNVSVTFAHESVQKSKVGSLKKTAELLGQHAADLSGFFASDPKAKLIPGFLAALASHLQEENALLGREFENILKSVAHIKSIVDVQQSYTGGRGVAETVSLPELMDDALKVSLSSFLRHGISVVRDYGEVPEIAVDKHKLFQIFVNLISNAKHAVKDRASTEKRVEVRIGRVAEGIQIEVADDGVGIPNENMEKIFMFGFTTKKGGHGFGLHSSALAAHELGGTLTARSPGPGLGATFRLFVPAAGGAP